jgi:hypothetical protein
MTSLHFIIFNGASEFTILMFFSQVCLKKITLMQEITIYLKTLNVLPETLQQYKVIPRGDTNYKVTAQYIRTTAFFPCPWLNQEVMQITKLMRNI